jgi:myo-inositol 2-dehydrogenase/D-chiro-inositol 1-dehydrogenase
MSEALPLGLIGCGRIAEHFYLGALAGLSEARLAAAADPRPERRRLIIDRVPGCAGFASAEELLAGGKVAAVVIATPTKTHAAIASLALKAGLPALIEKPLAASVAEVESLRSGEGTIMVAFNRRFWRPVQRLRDLLHRHAGPASARLVMRADRSIWLPISEQSDPLDDLGCHQLDLLRYLFGREVESVRAKWTGPATIRMRVALSGGIDADCEAAHVARSEESIEVRCDGLAYRIRRGSERLTPPEGPVRAALDSADTLLRRLRRQPSSLRRSYEHQLRYFVRSVSGRTAPQPSLADGLAVARAVDAARRSAANSEQEIRITP